MKGMRAWDECAALRLLLSLHFKALAPASVRRRDERAEESG